MAHIITPEGAGIALLNYFSGFALTSDSGAPNTKIDVARGMCADSENAVMISYAGGSIDFTTVGPGGLDTGSIGANASYNLFAIQGGAGGAAVSSVIASLSSSPSFANAAAYSTYRLIGTASTNGSSHVVASSIESAPSGSSIPTPASGDANKIVAVNGSGTGFDLITGDLLPTPGSSDYGKTVQVNSAASAYELAGPIVAFKNRLINGDMRIDQRNEGAATTPATTSANIYVVDRWAAFNSVASKLTYQRVADAPAGFVNSLKVTVAAQYNPAAGERFLVLQPIEGANVADLAFGNAAALPASISFWVKASITGTYTAFLQNSAGARSYLATFAIGAANTWTRVTLPNIAGDTGGVWATDNSAGILLGICLGGGATYQAAAAAWQAGNYVQTAASVQFVDQVNGSTFQLTGAQFEEGPTCTAFDRRDFGTELRLCRRYFEKSYDIGTVPGTVTSASMVRFYFTTASAAGVNIVSAIAEFKSEKRASPTMTYYSPISGTSGNVYTDSDRSAAPLEAGLNRSTVSGNIGGTAASVQLLAHWTANSEI